MISMNYNPIGHKTEVKKKKRKKKLNFFHICYCIIVFPIYLILKIKQLIRRWKNIKTPYEELMKTHKPDIKIDRTNVMRDEYEKFRKDNDNIPPKH